MSVSAPTVWVGKLLPFNERLCLVRLRADSIRPYRAYAKYKQGTLFIFSVPCLYYSVGLLS